MKTFGKDKMNETHSKRLQIFCFRLENVCHDREGGETEGNKQRGDICKFPGSGWVLFPRL